MTHLTAYKTRLVILTFLVRTITTRTLLDGTFTGTLIPTLRPTSTLHPVTTATIPYTRSTPETITHILQLYNIRVAHNCLPMSRTKKKAKDRQGVVYNIKCCDCQASYIGKTGRNPSTRLTQHKRVTRNGDVNIQSHCWAPFADKTSNCLGLCDMYNVFYRLLSSYSRKLAWVVQRLDSAIRVSSSMVAQK